MVNKKISHTKVCDIFYESINIRLFHLLKANFIKNDTVKTVSFFCTSVTVLLSPLFLSVFMRFSKVFPYQYQSIINNFLLVLF